MDVDILSGFDDELTGTLNASEQKKTKRERQKWRRY